MIPKSKAPGLNRKQRRHPQPLQTIARGGLPWLLFALFLRCPGCIAAEPERMVGRSTPQPSLPEKAVGLVGRIKRGLSRWFGR